MAWKIQDWRLPSISNNKNLKEVGNRIAFFVKSMPFLIGYHYSEVTPLTASLSKAFNFFFSDAFWSM